LDNFSNVVDRLSTRYATFEYFFKELLRFPIPVPLYLYRLTAVEVFILFASSLALSASLLSFRECKGRNLFSFCKFFFENFIFRFTCPFAHFQSLPALRFLVCVPPVWGCKGEILFSFLQEVFFIFFSLLLCPLFNT
jgi:hypothetical protein